MFIWPVFPINLIRNMETLNVAFLLKGFSLFNGITIFFFLYWRSRKHFFSETKIHTVFNFMKTILPVIFCTINFKRCRLLCAKQFFFVIVVKTKFWNTSKILMIFLWRQKIYIVVPFAEITIPVISSRSFFKLCHLLCG